jgi:hypothetical protein
VLAVAAAAGATVMSAVAVSVTRDVAVGTGETVILAVAVSVIA